VNIAGPTPATSGGITRGLAEVLRRWHPWTVPTSAIRALGDAGRDLLLTSESVAPQRLLADGFAFRHESARAALSELSRER
jgi:NAD dependent epimerase/dehydratase family enzyme